MSTDAKPFVPNDLKSVVIKTSLNLNAAEFVSKQIILCVPNVQPINKLKFYYCNSRSLMNKLPELHDLLYSENYCVLCFTETGLCEKVTDGLLDPCRSCDLFRCDRKAVRPAGSVIIAVNKKLNAYRLSTCRLPQT